MRASAARRGMTITRPAHISLLKGGGMTKSKDAAGKAASPTSTDKPTSARLLPNRPVEKDESPRDKAFGAAAGELTADQLETKQVEHPALLADPKEAKTPAAVQNGRMHATYVGLGLERDKKGEKLVHLDFSFPLISGIHDGLIPEKVKNAWYYLQESDDIAVKINGMPPVTLSLYLDPKEKKPLLHLVGADFSRAIVQIIEEVGKGSAKKVTRFAFRVLVERTADVIDFAAWRDGETFWCLMPATQKKIGE